MSTSPRLAAAKRDWGHDETGCTTLHIDMDAFFASCEIARHPELKGKPVIIGTGPRSVVSAASYEARPFGVNSAMPTATARRLCPQGVFLPVDMAYYREISRRVFALFGQVTDRIERVSVDECYMDVSGALRRWERPTAIGAWLRSEVARNFGLTCSVGVASNKLVAKLASTNAKPNGMLLIPVARQAEFVQLLPLRSIPGVGPALGRRLEHWGVTTVAQLAELSETEIAQACGSATHAHSLYLAARGLDERAVTPVSPEKSIGAERTFDRDAVTAGEVTSLLLWGADRVASTLRGKRLMARTITVKLRFADLSYSTKSHTVETPVTTASAIYPESVRLLERMLGMPEGSASDDGRHLPRPVRLAGVSVSGLADTATTPVQASFDDLLAEEDADRNPDSAGGRTTRVAESTRRHGGSDDGGHTGMAGKHGRSGGNASDNADDVRDHMTNATIKSVNAVRMSQAEKALDSIRQRYGSDAVRLGLRRPRGTHRTGEE
ncbi:DNA polymerase IV [Bifidobacterium callimiconis]|uniref:DNA polymerase IV n=1 Tax=Bifidobacterium callimiconis TaxID=2306973 RepID=A0A430FCF4_9BIFI|nr:DNA polymerase IV [Bifidobacterium callimiconis]MBT1177435.1 DNA polymerase IV [Bifidobacterium callimiconis]RSX50488.1 DNA polymerase IV [Bifidobacterium callimiconis]